MQSVIVVVFLICVAQLTQAGSISEIQIRIVLEGNFATTQVDLFKQSATQAVSSARSTLNSKAQNIRFTIQQGPAGCQVWLSQIDTIQKSINFLYEFRRCEEGGSNPVKPYEIRSRLSDLKRQADIVQANCNFNRGFNCKASVDTLERTLDVIHDSVASGVARMKIESDQCIADRVQVHNKSLDSALSYFQKCK